MRYNLQQPMNLSGRKNRQSSHIKRLDCGENVSTLRVQFPCHPKILWNWQLNLPSLSLNDDSSWMRRDCTLVTGLMRLQLKKLLMHWQKDITSLRPFEWYLCLTSNIDLRSTINTVQKRLQQSSTPR